MLEQGGSPLRSVDLAVKSTVESGTVSPALGNADVADVLTCEERHLPRHIELVSARRRRDGSDD